MKRLHSILLACFLAFGATGCATAEPRVGVHLNIDLFPDLVPIPGYPVYYAPHVHANFFFYDGLYWVLEGDGWYSSYWYNGPWHYVEPDFVPWFVLRVPVRYYRAPPPYFRGWHYDAPPRWGHYWGPGWQVRHYGWDRWDRQHVPMRAPIPSYQRDYRGNRYPDYRRQRELNDRYYNYRPQDPRYRGNRDDRRDYRQDGRQDGRREERRNEGGQSGWSGQQRPDQRDERRDSGDRPYRSGFDNPQQRERNVQPRGPDRMPVERERSEQRQSGWQRVNERPDGWQQRGGGQQQREYRAPQQEQRQYQPPQRQQYEQPRQPAEPRSGWQRQRGSDEGGGGRGQPRGQESRGQESRGQGGWMNRER
jgi:hypothetical protein